jgi:hypothetical protein
MHYAIEESKLHFPDVNSLCLVVKSLIKEKSNALSLKIIEIFAFKYNKNECFKYNYGQLDKDQFFKIIESLNAIQDQLNIELNTFLLNGYFQIILKKVLSSNSIPVANTKRLWCCLSG